MGKRTSRIEEINSRGLARGWHAEQLLKKAQMRGKSMAECFKEQTSDSWAFSVPAKCVGYSARWIDYEFLDGSKTSIVNTQQH